MNPINPNPIRCHYCGGDIMLDMAEQNFLCQNKECRRVVEAYMDLPEGQCLVGSIDSFPVIAIADSSGIVGWLDVTWQGGQLCTDGVHTHIPTAQDGNAGSLNINQLAWFMDVVRADVVERLTTMAATYLNAPWECVESNLADDTDYI